MIYYGLSPQLHLGAGDLNSCALLVQEVTCSPPFLDPFHCFFAGP